MINYNSLLLLLLAFISTYTFPNEGSPLIGQTHKKNIISNEENEDIGAYDINYGSDADVFSGETHNFFLECNELTEDRVVLGINEQIAVGGTIWYDDNQDGVFNFPTENGIGAVEVYLIDVLTGVPIASTFTDFADGSYIFEDIDSGEYIILVTGSNFMGGPLNYNESSIGQADADNDVDDDDNGDDDVTDGSESTPFFLTYGEEPGPDGNVNTTIDFGFWVEFDCAASTLSEASCELLDEFDLICNLNILNEYCATMPPPPLVGPAPSPLCPTGGGPHNMSWFSFVAGTGDYTIEVVPNNCQPSPNGDIGVQIGIYTDCTFSEAVICDPNCSTSPVTLNSSALTPGETYYFFLDGCSGSICDYDVNISGSFTPFEIPEPTGLTCENIDCSFPVIPGQEVTFVVEGLELDITYIWSIPNGVVVLNPLDPENQTEENRILIIFTTIGTYEVCMDIASNGCDATFTPVCLEIDVVNFVANATSTPESFYAANDGTATCSPNGSDSYQFAWSNGDSTQEILNLMPGNYIVTVNDVLYNMQAIDTVSVEAYICDTIILEIEYTNIACFEDCDGSIDILSVNNATAPLTYVWNTGDTTGSQSNLCFGEYMVTITDAKNCIITDSYTITEPDELFANANVTDEMTNDANDGTATCAPTGGTSPYTYAWSNSDTTQSVSNLAPGSYLVTVTDANACTSLDTVNVSAYVCPDLTITSQASDASCYGECDGLIEITGISNATAPFTYLWNTGNTTASQSNLCTGEYMVTITDAENCTVSDSFMIIEPDEMLITVDSIRHVRLDPLGYIFITTNDNGRYIFDWSGPGNFTATTEDIENLTDPGCYTITITDTLANCSIDSTICLDDLTSVYYLEMSHINMYPNPTRDNFIIDFRDTKIVEAAIILYDLSGKQQMVLEKQTNNQMVSVNAEMLNSGLYLVEIQSEKYGAFYKKLVLLK